MKNILAFLAFYTFLLFLTSCCQDSDDIPLPAETKTWVPYSEGQTLNFTNNKQETFTLKAFIKDANYEVTPSKRACSYEVERRELKLENTVIGTIALHVAIENRYLYFGKSNAEFNAEVTFDLNDNFNEGPNANYNRHEYLPEITLNGVKFVNIIHYSTGTVPDQNNLFEEYYYAKDLGLVAFKLPNNPSVFYKN